MWLITVDPSYFKFYYELFSTVFQNLSNQLMKSHL